MARPSLLPRGLSTLKAEFADTTKELHLRCSKVCATIQSVEIFFSNCSRPNREIRRYSCQRWHSCLAPVKPVPQESSFACQNHFCLIVVSRIRPSSGGRSLLVASAAAFRMILTPIDTLKTTLQAQGARGTALLRRRIKSNGIGSLWWGAFATAAATFVGHYPWFATVSPDSKSIDTKLICFSTTTCPKSSPSPPDILYSGGCSALHSSASALPSSPILSPTH